jgi:hypothetical protein
LMFKGKGLDVHITYLSIYLYIYLSIHTSFLNTALPALSALLAPQGPCRMEGSLGDTDAIPFTNEV